MEQEIEAQPINARTFILQKRAEGLSKEIETFDRQLGWEKNVKIIEKLEELKGKIQAELNKLQGNNGTRT